MIKRFFAKWHTVSPIFTIVAACLFPLVLLCHILSTVIPSFADFINRGPAAGVRFLLAKLSGILPISFAELLILSLIPLAVFAVICAVRLGKKEDEKPSLYFLSSLIGALLVLYFLFVFTLGTAYFGTPIDEEMGLDKKDVSAVELFDTAQILLSEAEDLLDEIEFDENGASVMPMSFRTLNKTLNAVYKDASKQHDFLSSLSSTVKPVILSKPLTYTHMSGIYTFLTGEANINTNFPDSTLPFTMAHEMAHQRGVAKEDEANFVAFLICIESDDAYIRYSGYYEMIKYFINALYEADTDLFEALYAIADDRIVNEIYAFNDFFEKYEDNPAASVTEGINDAYQQIQGVEEGIRSYGLVVDLTVAYYKAKSVAAS